MERKDRVCPTFSLVVRCIWRQHHQPGWDFLDGRTTYFAMLPVKQTVADHVRASTQGRVGDIAELGRVADH